MKIYGLIENGKIVKYISFGDFTTSSMDNLIDYLGSWIELGNNYIEFDIPTLRQDQLLLIDYIKNYWGILI